MTRHWALTDMILSICVMLICWTPSSIYGEEQRQEKGKHFVVLYSGEEQKSWAREILRAAEQYYTKIASKIDYARYNNFWTWGDRVQIIVYPDQDSFIKESGMPAWSKAGAYREKDALAQRKIITYKQEEHFNDGILPHEISHLMLRDFIGDESKIPVWFDEGVAQIQEKERKIQANYLMRNLIAAGQYIPLDQLFSFDIRREKDPTKVAFFYAESVTIVLFLMDRYGSDSFGRLCHAMQDGSSFEEALTAAYPLRISSISDLGKKWLRYMQN